MRADYLEGMKQLALALALALAAPAVSAAEKLPLAKISDYLNGIATARATFVQVNDDGSLSTGRFFIRRPGRMRFEYDPPDSGVVVARAGAVLIYDPKSNLPPETYPLRRTPLSIILARSVDLERARMVVGYDFDGTYTIVKAQDPDNPEYGWIEMFFSDDPVALVRWIIHDGNGGETTVELGEMTTGIPLSDTLFGSGSEGIVDPER